MNDEAPGAQTERHALALDLGGTKLEAALVGGAGDVLAASRHRAPTGPDSTPESLTSAIRTVVPRALAALPPGAELLGAGIGSAGPLDEQNGAIYAVNMTGAHGFRLADAVRDALAENDSPVAPVRLRLDGQCLALAESRWGAAQDTGSSMSVVVSTGIGGGVIVDGRIISGRSGNAGHIGQTHVSLHGLPGGESEPGSVEPLASGPNIVRWARSQGWHGETGEDLARAAADGDPLARTAIERSATLVGRAFADAATLLDLEMIVVGGGFSRVSDDYVDLVGQSLRASAPLEYARNVRIVRSALDDRGPLLGAAALILS